MTKSELIVRVSTRFPQLVAKDTEIAVTIIIGEMIKGIARGQRVEICGFGSFKLSQRPARKGRNPRSGAPVHVPAKRVPHFKAGKELRERVNALRT